MAPRIELLSGRHQDPLLREVAARPDMQRNPSMVPRAIMERSFDLTRPLSLIYSAMTTLVDAKSSTAQRKGAREMLSGVERYFKAQGLTVRSYIPRPALQDDATDLEQNRITAGAIRDKFIPQLEAAGQSVPSLVKNVATNAEQVRTQSTSPEHETIMIASSAVGKHPNFQALTQIYHTIFNLMTGASQQQMEDVQRMHAREEILDNARASSSLRVPGVPDIWTTTYNRVSLQQLFNEKSTDRFVQGALAYLSGMPQGNLFWPPIAEGVFFMVGGNRAQVRPEQFRYPQFLRNVTAFQTRLINKLLEPTVGNGQGDSRFDRNFIEILHRLDYYAALNLAEFLYSYAVYGSSSEAVFNPTYKQDVIAAAKDSVVGRRAIREDGAFMIDRSIVNMLKVHGVAIVADWKKRFGSGMQIDTLCEAFLKKINDIDYEKNNGDFFKAFAQKCFPEHIWTGIAEYTDPKEIASEIEREIAQDECEVVPLVKHAYGVRFPEHSAAHRMGFASVSIHKIEEDGTYRYILDTVDDLQFGGWCNGDLAITDAVMPQEQPFPGLVAVIQGVLYKGMHEIAYYRGTHPEEDGDMHIDAKEPKIHESERTAIKNAHDMLGQFLEGDLEIRTADS